MSSYFDPNLERMDMELHTIGGKQDSLGVLLVRPSEPHRDASGATDESFIEVYITRREMKDLVRMLDADIRYVRWVVFKYKIRDAVINAFRRVLPVRCTECGKRGCKADCLPF